MTELMPRKDPRYRFELEVGVMELMPREIQDSALDLPGPEATLVLSLTLALSSTC